MATEILPPTPTDAPAAIPVASVPPAGTPVAIPAPPPEEVLHTIDLAMGRRYPVRCVLYVALIAGLFSMGGWGLAAEYTGFALACFVFAVVVTLRFGWWWWRMSNTDLIITNRRVILASGVLARQMTEFPLADITDLMVDQGVWGHMVGVGDLAIISDRADRRQVVVMAVPNPSAVAAQIRDAKDG